MTERITTTSTPAVKRKRGGPSTVEGKAAAAKNAVTHGIWATWLNEKEQSVYDFLVEQLMSEYDDQTPTVRMLIDEAATASIKLKRVRGIENALYEKARILKSFIESKPHENSISSMLPRNAQSDSFAVDLAAAAALPDMHKLDTLARYETSLERQMFKSLQALKVLKDERLRSAEKLCVGVAQPLLIPHDARSAEEQHE